MPAVEGGQLMQGATDAVTNPHEIEQFRNRLELWRREHRGRRPLPEELWSEAAQLAQQYGVYRTAKVLRLSYQSLKQHLPADIDRRAKRKKTTTKFLELLPLSSALPECNVEFENGRGAKMKIQLKGTAMSELPNLTRLFWREL
jgi:hypothetical protein